MAILKTSKLNETLEHTIFMKMMTLTGLTDAYQEEIFRLISMKKHFKIYFKSWKLRVKCLGSTTIKQIFLVCSSSLYLFGKFTKNVYTFNLNWCVTSNYSLLVIIPRTSRLNINKCASVGATTIHNQEKSQLCFSSKKEAHFFS